MAGAFRLVLMASVLAVASGLAQGAETNVPVVQRLAPELRTPEFVAGIPAKRPRAPFNSPLPQPAKRALIAPSPAARAALQAAIAGPIYPRPRRRLPPSCTEDGHHCIGPLTYLADVCEVIGSTAREAGLDPHFFARLIWRESLFQPYAVSHAGARGIAQFMPSTAALRELDDPFNPAEALRASAHYLRELQVKFGNLGLAAGAYNGGEGRMERYLASSGGLPRETRAYVSWITGHSAETWRNDPPKELDLTLRPELAFPTACQQWAKAHKAPSAPPGGTLRAWGMIYAAHADRHEAAEKAAVMRERFPGLLGDAAVEVHRTKMPGSGRILYTARLETETRMTAARLCTRLRRAGGGCMVLRN